MQIRKTRPEELPVLMRMYEEARSFMREHGNPNQWGTTKPGQAQIEADIACGGSYVCTEGDEIIGTFFFKKMDDPSYEKIYEGAWKDDSPYGVVHRITTDRGRRGTAAFCMKWALAQADGHVRIDTHEDNLVMQRFLEKMGFARCGIIFVEDGTARLAYERSETLGI